MDPRFRSPFNRAFSSDNLYARYQERLRGLTQSEFHFRLAETPVFIPPQLLERIRSSAERVMAQLCDPPLIERMKGFIPPQWNVPRMDSLPSFAQVDFAIVEESDGTPGVRLIELQGFPSLAALEVMQRDAWQSVLEGVDGLEHVEWSCWFGQSHSEFLDLLGHTILGGHEPADVIMLDIDPRSQKTWPDFAATQKLFGVTPVSITDLEVDGRRLYRGDGGGRKQVRRIYNRVVFDELIEKRIQAPFSWNDELDVEWAPHPNWYWVWSKATIPFLRDPSIPETHLLSEIDSIPDDLAGWVLKPLFSFAGGGVIVGPSPDQVDAVPSDRRGDWCLQRRIEYAPLLKTPQGAGVKVEFRCMFFRRDGDSRMTLAQNLCRLARGRMLGVDFNKDFDWVGGTVGLWEQEKAKRLKS